MIFRKILLSFLICVMGSKSVFSMSNHTAKILAGVGGVTGGVAGCWLAYHNYYMPSYQKVAVVGGAALLSWLATKMYCWQYTPSGLWYYAQKSYRDYSEKCNKIFNYLPDESAIEAIDVNVTLSHFKSYYSEGDFGLVQGKKELEEIKKKIDNSIKWLKLIETFSDDQEDKDILNKAFSLFKNGQEEGSAAPSYYKKLIEDTLPKINDDGTYLKQLHAKQKHDIAQQQLELKLQKLKVNQQKAELKKEKSKTENNSYGS